MSPLQDIFFIALACAGYLSTIIIATVLVVSFLRRGTRSHGRLYFTSTAIHLAW